MTKDGESMVERHLEKARDVLGNMVGISLGDCRGGFHAGCDAKELQF